RRLDGQTGTHADRRLPVALGAQTAQGAEDEPHQAEVAQLGGAVEDAVGDRVAAHAIEGAVDPVVEAGDAISHVVGDQRHPPTVVRRGRAEAALWRGRGRRPTPGSTHGTSTTRTAPTVGA